MDKYRIAASLDTTASAKLLYLVLLDVADDKNEVVISQRKMSRALGLHKRTVARNLHVLQKSGLITIRPRYSDCGGQMPNIYHVL